MANTTISTAVRAKQWDSKLFAEYVRASRFKRYMGIGENSIIQVKRDLTKKKGDAITVNLIGALDASSGPNDGSTALVNNDRAATNTPGVHGPPTNLCGDRKIASLPADGCFAQRGCMSMST